jgi:hypothetical protein
MPRVEQTVGCAFISEEERCGYGAVWVEQVLLGHGVKEASAG